MFLASCALASVGLYTPLFYLGEHLRREEEGEAALLLLHLWLGLAAIAGCLLAGYIITSDSYNFYISRRLLVQVRGILHFMVLQMSGSKAASPAGEPVRGGELHVLPLPGEGLPRPGDGRRHVRALPGHPPLLLQGILP